MTQLEEALGANLLRQAVSRLRAHVEVADHVSLSVRDRLPLIRQWCRLGVSPKERVATVTDPWRLIGERISWLIPTDWLSIPVDNGGWFTIRSHQGFVGLRHALDRPTNDIFIIQGAHACALMDEEHGLELFDSAGD